MSKGGWGNVLRSVHALLDEGVVADLSDRELLERYALGSGESAERAFAVLVERHGAMVRRVCRSVLRDEHEAQDAFQATFLVLARKASSLWVRNSLGPWLHGAAYRTSSCARSAAVRRRAHERRAAEQSLRLIEQPEPDDLGGVLHEEVNRLPERFRAPVVLCYLEGLTHEQAAERLRCPVGTVRSRLSTGRERLRARLERRGFASSDGVMASALGSAATTGPVSAAMAESAVRMGLSSTAGGAVSATIVALAERGLKTMWFSRLTVLSFALLTIGGGTIGTLALAQRGPGAQEPAPPAKPVSGSPTPQDTTRQPSRSVNEEARRKLLEARIETARAILQTQERLFQNGEVGFEDVPPWSRRLMDARLSLATTPAERLAAIREHRNCMLIYQRRLGRLFEAGQVTSAETLKGKYYRLEADELLAEAGGDPNNEAPTPEPKPAPTAPPPAPPGTR
jgi:RNA polymerase sigma factor (sigma-70 family)